MLEFLELPQLGVDEGHRRAEGFLPSFEGRVVGKPKDRFRILYIIGVEDGGLAMLDVRLVPVEACT